MSQSQGLRFRQIHLDFHTSPHIPGIGEFFDPEEFASTLAEAHVNSITVFAKCHHGQLYYETDHAAKHPHLTGNLLKQQIDALHAKGIRAPIYISVQCDEFAANAHPEWIALNEDGSRVGRKPLSGDYFSWQILDMSSPYVDYLCEQIREVLEKFAPVDGLFFDMCWDQPSVSNWAKAGMAKAGLNPESEADRRIYSRQVSLSYMDRIKKLIDSRQKDVPVFFNSRPLIRLHEEKKFLKHVEVEALPSGQWGYLYFPVNIRFVRPLGMPTLGMTGRFHKSWADFGGLRTVPSLLYDCTQALAHGAACSVGDQLHPTGKIDHGVYSVIGEVYRYVEKCEPWVRDAKAAHEIAVLFTEATSANEATDTYNGVYRTLTPLGYQYDFVLPEDPWESYSLVVVPRVVELTDSLRARLDAFKKKGGKVLIELSEGESSPYTVTYLRFEAQTRGDLPETDHVFYEHGVRLLPQAGDTVLAKIVEPYFERTWEHFSSHAQTPNRPDVSPYAAGVVNGNEARFALPVFVAAARHANLPCRQLIAAAMERLLPRPILRLKSAKYVEAVYNELPGKQVVHLLSFIPQKKTSTMEMVEEAVPARDLRVAVRQDRKVKSVTLQPENRPVEFAVKDGYAVASLDWIEGHTMVVFDLE
jgi:hypothetical protein